MPEDAGEHALAARAERALAWLFDDALPVWSAHGRNPAGGWHDRLDDTYIPVATPMRMRVQGRQVFVFAEAGRLGWDGPWREMVAHGLDFLIERATRPDGLAAQTFAADDGRVLEPGPDLYDQAFALFAYAAAYAATGEPRAKAAGLRLLEALAAQAHPSGGFREFDSPLLRANPQMHLLEAALLWTTADDDPRWLELARSLARLCADRLFDPATDALHEVFEGDWRRPPGPSGELTEPGHPFEWAWLLNRPGLGVPDRLVSRLCERAERLGVDSVRGVAMNSIDPWGKVLDGDARLWPQAERLKAALMMRLHDQVAWTASASQAHDALFSFMAPAPRGLWRDVVRADGSLRPEFAPASSLYHITCAVSELVQVTGVVQARW
jgi:mannose-6-phosphate isomerase